MTKAEMVDLLSLEVKNLSSKFTSNDYSNACDDAERETGWSFPVSDSFKIFWQKNRAKRHLVSYLLLEYGKDYKFEKNEMQMRFANFSKLIFRMDQEYKDAQEERPDQFANVSAYELFGSKIDAGFRYNSVGEDITYDDNNEVIVTPNEES